MLNATQLQFEIWELFSTTCTRFICSFSKTGFGILVESRFISLMGTIFNPRFLISSINNSSSLICFSLKLLR